MYVILLAYKTDLDRADRHQAAYRRLLREGYASDAFPMSDRKVPLDGGPILARSASSEQPDTLARQAPFGIENMAGEPR